MPDLWMCALLAFYSFILFCVGRKILVLEVFILCQPLPARFFFPENKLTSDIILEICCCTEIFPQMGGIWSSQHLFFTLLQVPLCIRPLNWTIHCEIIGIWRPNACLRRGGSVGHSPVFQSALQSLFVQLRQMCTWGFNFCNFACVLWCGEVPAYHYVSWRAAPNKDFA